MIRKSNIYVKNMYVSVLLIAALLTQSALLRLDTDHFTIFISAGFSIGLIHSFGKKVLPGVIISTIVFTLFYEVFFDVRPLLASFLYSLSILMANVLIPLIFIYFLKLFKIDTPRNARESLFYTIALFLSVGIVSTLPAIQESIVNNTNIFYEFYLYFFPIFAGAFIFGTAIRLSNQFDSYLGMKNLSNFWDTAFALLYVAFVYFMFTDTLSGFTFNNYSYLLILLFMINAFVFNYRMLVFLSWVYIILYNIFSESVGVHYSSLNLYLLILMVITVFTKILIHEIIQKNEDLNETKDRYEDMFSSTIELLNIKNTMSFNDISYAEENLRNIFDIGLKIFHKVEYATCSIKDGHKLVIIDTKGHDNELYTSLDLDIDKFSWSNFSPVLKENINEIYKNALGHKYSAIAERLPKIKQSISILIKLTDTDIGAITFDILKGSEQVFTESDVYNIKAFQNLINSFFDMNKLTLKNISLKDDIVLSLIRTLEIYDQYTGGHSADVAFLAGELCKELEVNINDSYDIYWAGIVHDIGKIGISSDIINKKTKLTLAEYKKVQEHPVLGYDILNKSEDLSTIAKLVKHHHEWFNGTGYPDRLKEDEIPFGAQILQVADSVSSMATKRSYQKEKNFKEILDELQLYRGVQFNPKIADAMSKLMLREDIQEYFKSRQE